MPSPYDTIPAEWATRMVDPAAPVAPVGLPQAWSSRLVAPPGPVTAQVVPPGTGAAMASPPPAPPPQLVGAGAGMPSSAAPPPPKPKPRPAPPAGGVPAAPAARPAAAPPAPSGPPRELGPDEILSLSPDQLAAYRRDRAVWKAYEPARYATVGRDVEAHAEPAGWQIQQRTPIDEETAKALDDATLARAQAEAEMQRLAASQLEEQAAAQELDAEQTEWDLRQEQARMVGVRQKMDQAIAQWDAESRAVRTARVDPTRYWRNMSVAGEIAAFIGLALGGRDASEAINRAQERDIELQLGDMERRERGLGDRRVALDDMMERYGDQKTAVAALKERQLGVVAQRAEAMKMRAQSDQQRAGIDLFLKQVDEKRAQLRVEWAQANAPVVNASVKWVPEQQAQTVRVGGGGGVDAALAAAGTGPTGAAAVGLSDREAATERSKLLDRIRNREAALQEIDSKTADYQRWALNPPSTEGEIAQAALPNLLFRAAVWNGLQGRQDAPSSIESSALNAVGPDISSRVGATAARYGIAGAKSAREGAVTAIQTQRARIKSLIEADKKRLSTLPITGASPTPQPAVEPSAK